MSGIFSTFNTANKGLIVQQAAMHTTGHNISNANTPGFSRQRVDMKADLAFNAPGVGQLGTGVKTDGVVRIVDDYISKQIRQENSVASQYSTKSDVLSQVEIIFNEPSDTGINANLGQMFDSWQELSKNPESLIQKTIVVEKSKTLAESLNHMSNQLDNLRDNTNKEIDKNVQDFNSTVDKLDSLNKQIFNVAIKGQVPNDLLDQRDILLKDLSGMADTTTTFDKYGRAEIKLDGKDVLVGVIKNTLEVDPTKYLNTGLVNSGAIAGNTVGLEEIDARKLELDNFANMMSTAINGKHDLANPIFTGTTAGTIKVSVTNDKVMAGYSISPGDGSRALEIAGLRNAKIPAVNGTTIEGSYINIVTTVGISKEYADNMVKNQGVLLDHLMMKREATSGVNIDEEMTNVIKFQTAYQANAKVISVLTDMLDTIINRMGV